MAEQVDFVFCAVDMPQAEVAALEEAYARAEVPLVSTNSAHRWTPDVPMMIPEINAAHSAIISAQRRRLRTARGFIAVKPNCSIQSYVPAIHPLLEILDNVIPYIGGEEEKSESEPLKIWGSIEGDVIRAATGPVISAQCIRVPVSDGHLAAVAVTFERPSGEREIISAWTSFTGRPQELGLPSAPHPFLLHTDDQTRPQTRLDRDAGNGQAITIGRLRPDAIFDWRFVALSHNTVRGAAGGAMLTAELLTSEGYISAC